MARTCSLIFIVLDVLKPLLHKRLIEKELEGFGIRLNKEPPNIVFKKKEKGGINLQTMVPQTELDLDLVKSILSEYRIHNADITLRYDATADDLIDVVEGNRTYIPCIYLLNKIDQVRISFFICFVIAFCFLPSVHSNLRFLRFSLFHALRGLQLQLICVSCFRAAAVCASCDPRATTPRQTTAWASVSSTQSPSPPGMRRNSTALASKLCDTLHLYCQVLVFMYHTRSSVAPSDCVVVEC